MTLYLEPQPDRAQQLLLALGGDAKAATGIEELVDVLRGDTAEQLVALGPSVALADAIAFASGVRLNRPTVGVVLLREKLDIAVLGDALRAGVREVVEAGDIDAVRGACARSLEISRQLGGGTGGGDGTQAKVITVFAGKGGCGKSTTATNLAVALAAGGSRRVLLMDLDLSFGDVAIMLQLQPERSLVEALPMAGRLDDTALKSLLSPYAPGVEALLAPSGPADGERIGRELVSEALTVAREMFDYIVVDTPPFFSDPVLAALDVADWYVLLATPDIPSLKNLRLTLDMFELMEYPKDRRVVVLNRSDSRVGLTQADIERVVRAPILGHIPSTKDVPVSINRGVPLIVDNPAHPVSRAIKDLATSVFASTGAPSVPVQDKPKRRGFGLRLGR